VKHMSKKLQVAVKAFILNEKREILLLEKDKKNRPEYSSKWDIPGGRIEPGVSLIRNLERELIEEIGCSLDLSFSPKLIFAQDVFGEDFHIVRLSYIVKVVGDIVLSSEHTDYRWFSYDRMLKEQSLGDSIQEVIDGGKLKDNL